MPKSNVEYRPAKIERNVKPYAETRSCLDRLGWKSKFIWKCEDASGVAKVAKELGEWRPYPVAERLGAMRLTIYQST